MPAKQIARFKATWPYRFWQKFSADRAEEGSILIAWAALFSLFPLLLGILALLGAVLGSGELMASVSGALTQHVPEQAAGVIDFLEETRDISGILGFLSALGLLWTGSNLFGTMATVFNRFYGVPDRGWIGQRIRDVGLTVAFAILLMLSVVMSSAAGVLVGLTDTQLPIRIPGLAVTVGWATSFAAITALFLVTLRLAPNTPLTMRHVLPGAVVGAVMLFAVTQAFPLYLHYVAGDEFEAYKLLGVFLLLITWLQFLALTFVVGAEVNAFLEAERARAAAPTTPTRTSASPEPPAVAKVALWAAWQAGVGAAVGAASRGTAGVIGRKVLGPPGR
jgi:membrane protein